MASCVEQLQAALGSNNPTEFVRSISTALRNSRGAFPSLKKELKSLLVDVRGGFVLDCIEEGLRVDGGAAICHLLLDTINDLDTWPTEPAVAASSRQLAVSVLLRCCQLQPRLAVKLAQAFCLTAKDLSVEQQVELLDAISALLDANATSASGVSLLLYFHALRHHFHLEAVVEDLVTSSQDQIAIKLVGEVDNREMQVFLVNCCLQYGQLRTANNVVKAFGLQQEFPDVEWLHKAKQLEKMVGKGLWGVAGQYVGEDPDLQRRLIYCMLAAGELSLAQQHQQLFGLEEEFNIHPEQLAAEQERRRQQFLQMPLPSTALHFVEGVDGLRAMADQLHVLLQQTVRHVTVHSQPGGAHSLAEAARGQHQGQRGEEQQIASPSNDGMMQTTNGRRPSHSGADLLACLGIDLEWQPAQDSGDSTPPSILQLSTDSHVFIVDLLALTTQEDQDALAAALAPVLSSVHVFKLGCGIASDFKKLAAHHPRAFSVAHSCLDLSTLWRSRHIEQTGKRSTAGFKKRAGEVSLSALAQSVLGKPLDKSCQVSEWGRRPLSTQQLLYAALDAHAAVLIFRGMGQLHHPYRTRQGLLHHAFTYYARQGAARTGNATTGSNGGDGGGPGTGGSTSFSDGSSANPHEFGSRGGRGASVGSSFSSSYHAVRSVCAGAMGAAGGGTCSWRYTLPAACTRLEAAQRSLPISEETWYLLSLRHIPAASTEVAVRRWSLPLFQCLPKPRWLPVYASTLRVPCIL